MGELTGVYLTVHTPRYCTLDAAFAGKVAHADFRPVRDALVQQGRDLAAGGPDVIVLNSCHLITTFPTVVDGTPRHHGVLTAQEAPDLIRGVEYDFPGHYALASAIVDRGRASGLLCTLANDIHFPLDYGTVMPIVCYLDRTQRLPVVPVSVCLASDLAECEAWGRIIAATIAESGLRVAFVASGALSHKLVRDPSRWPSAEDQALDRRVMDLVSAGEQETLRRWLPEYACATEPEMGGRHLAMMLGVLAASGRPCKATVRAYGPSSGSGNAVISMGAIADAPPENRRRSGRESV